MWRDGNQIGGFVNGSGRRRREAGQDVAKGCPETRAYILGIGWDCFCVICRPELTERWMVGLFLRDG